MIPLVTANRRSYKSVMKTDSLQQYLVLQQSLRREKTALELRLTRINAVLANRGTSVADSRAAGKARRVRKPLPRIKNPMSLRVAIWVTALPPRIP